MAAKEVTRHDFQPVRTPQTLQQEDPGAEQHGVAQGDESHLFSGQSFCAKRGGHVIPDSLFFRTVGAHREMGTADFRLLAQIFPHNGERQTVASFAPAGA
jgi:hypothetical protein